MKKLTSVHDEYEVRERLRKTRLNLNAHINLAAALMEPKPWVGLTGDEIEDLPKGGTWWETIRAAEAILKERNGG